MIFRRLSRRGREMRITPPAFAAFCSEKSLRCVCEIMQQLAARGVENLCSNGNFHDLIMAVAAVPIGSFAMAASFGVVFGIVSQMKQRVEAFVRFQPDIAAFAAVATRRPASRDKLLPPKGRDAVPAIAGLHADLYAVDKHQ